jgi:hypothetical protein
MPEGGGKKPRPNYAGSGFVDPTVSGGIDDPLTEDMWQHIIKHSDGLVGQSALSSLSQRAHEASQHIPALRFYHDLAGTVHIGSRFLQWMAARQFEAPKYVGEDVVKHVDFMEKIFKRIGKETTPQALWTAFLENPRVRFFPVPAWRNQSTNEQLYEVWAEPLGWVQREYVLTSFEECLADLDRANAGSFMGAKEFECPDWGDHVVYTSRAVCRLLAVAMKHMKTPMPVHRSMLEHVGCKRDDSLTKGSIRAVLRTHPSVTWAIPHRLEVDLGIRHYQPFSLTIPFGNAQDLFDAGRYADFFTALAAMQIPPPLEWSVGEPEITALVNVIGAIISGKADLVPDYWERRTEFPETKDLTMAGAPNSMFFAIVQLPPKSPTAAINYHLIPLVHPDWDIWEPETLETAPLGTAVLQTIRNAWTDTREAIPVRDQEWDWGTVQNDNVDSVAYLAQWMAWLGGSLF